ncbi:M48 family metallopeptidase [Roseovarius salinarum]|uniref:M48 family metallopeptidase n=1 Tax=Roseovarius salinarum TaxID=1981892 RepID=UPI000C34527F|nr:M48 family metallopeptidase [Roseovarius salinarum]
MRGIALICLVVVAGCAAAPVAGPDSAPESGVAPMSRAEADAAAARFIEVVETVEPVAEDVCRARTRGLNCDFAIVVDDRPGQSSNAFQTLTRGGRPVIVFTLAMIADARNRHEMAFVMSHETAHHIAGHIPRQQRNAAAGAIALGNIATLSGAGPDVIRDAQQLGAVVGARQYSKAFELEADALGTLIAKRAGYDPLRGAEFFTRIPDPGDRFLGTHPPNARRMETVRRVAAGQ